MAPVLEDLLDDDRLARLFSKDDCSCALQLWVLQIKAGKSTENRVIYGRLLPYRFSNNSWSASEDDRFTTFGQARAQIVRLNLYLKSALCAELLERLSAGQTISAISEDFELSLSDKLRRRFGETALAAGELVYRPVAYLLNRDARDHGAPSSPHGGGGAFSASIVRTDQGALFRLDQDYDVALTAFVVETLHADTGLDFGGVDNARFGELELLVFPALDDYERPLLTVSWTNEPLVLVARFDPQQMPQFSGFQFRLCIANDSEVVYSQIAAAQADAGGVFECRFELSGPLHARTDSTELEIFGFYRDQPHQSALCCRWRVGYIREVNVQGHLMGRGASPVKFDWLERATRPAASPRVNAALTFSRSNAGFGGPVGGRLADPWVPPRRDLAALFARLHPPKSEGRFFLRWSQGDGEGRLQFVEWFKSLLTKYPQHQVVIFDPYFETAGLGLILIGAVAQADYVVFTSLPKPPKVGEDAPEESGNPPPDRLDNLVLACERGSHLLKGVKLRIYGLKHGRLHDRYILVMAPDGLPAAGFNLSNSFQSVAENYPLLITPIPADTLLQVEKYQRELVREAEATPRAGDPDDSSTRLLFDSKASRPAPRRHEPLRFLEHAEAGDVLSIWTDEPSLQGLSGDLLKARMESLDLVKDGALALPEAAGLHRFLAQRGGDFADFAATWEVIGDLLARSTSDNGGGGLEPAHDFLEFLVRFVEASLNRTHDAANGELAAVSAEFFRKPVEDFLRGAYKPHDFFHPTKYAALRWSEYYAIQFLWWHVPEALLLIAEEQMASVPVEPQASDAVRLSLLSQIVSEVAWSTQVGAGEAQRTRLVCSSNGLLQWIGLNALEKRLEEPDGLAAALQSIAAFSYPERVNVLGWMVRRAAGKPNAAEIYNDLVAALHEVLPRRIPAADLNRLVDALSGPARRLSSAGPWLFQDVIYPLLESDRANADDACEIWMRELTALMEPKLGPHSVVFGRAREGQTTSIAAFLFARSSPERQRASLASIRDVLSRKRRILQQPLASTSDWTRWNTALVVSMWVLTFGRWGLYHQRQRGVADRGLEPLSRDARELALIRPMTEWRSMGTGSQGELAAFFDQVEDLFADPLLRSE